ncbi:HAMP domain-containing protein [Acetobacter okinawensis]|uniref:methyl-accepting chemotaxis protein n=1 Tax=Acetobacter okinawensis TaxID=1076594 RepID=UPI001BAA774B|nr:methyl-accepting chemotaxis protein [Acetobacter okinawensis]MBS0965851.1 HAMP domain-containing protein [Acetobacter okinawensis]
MTGLPQTSSRLALSTRILMMCGLSFTIIQVVAVTLSSHKMEEQVKANIYSEALSKSQNLSTQILSKLAEQDAVVRSNATAIEAAHKAGVANRVFLVNLLQQSKQSFPSIFAVWMQEKPKGFDGTQDPHALANSSTGILNPYVTQDSTGKTVLSIFTEHFDKPWYVIPMTTGKGVLTEPYVDDDSKVEMVSFAYPIVFDGNRIGVTGLDTPLDWMSSLLKSIPITEGATLSLLSDDMLWISNPDPALLMHKYIPAPDSKELQAIKAHKVVILHGLNNNTTERLIVPFEITGFPNYWTLVVDIPASVIAKPVWNNMIALVVPGLVLIVISILLMYFILNRLLRKPLRNLIGSVTNLSNGHYTETVFGTERNDEIGAVAHGLEGFRTSLLKARQTDAQAATARAHHEELQKKRHLEDEERLNNSNLVIKTLGAALNRLALGDLSTQINRPLSAEFEPLRENFNQSVQQLATAMQSISSSVHTLREGTHNVSTGATDLARRTEQQAATLEETTAAINEISKNVFNSAKTISQAQKLGVSARETALVTSTMMSKTRAAMEVIDRRSKEIVDITEVIDNIAFQTNILAVNAGIEAASAGEAGRGFAVVANEVRILAQSCTDAAKSIGSLIRKTTEEIHTGSIRVQDTERSLSEILEVIANISDKLTTISGSANDQSTSLEEISSSINVIDQTTQKNAIVADDSRSASCKLAEETEKLTNLVSRFRL